MPDARFFKLALIDDEGNIVIRKNYRVYKELREVNETQAQMLGRELARDAMHYAGYWKPNA